MKRSTSKATLDIDTPMTPNFLRMKGQDVGIPIGVFTDADLRNVGRAWTEELIAKAQERRKTQRKSGTPFTVDYA